MNYQGVWISTQGRHDCGCRRLINRLTVAPLNSLPLSTFDLIFIFTSPHHHHPRDTSLSISSRSTIISQTTYQLIVDDDGSDFNSSDIVFEERPNPFFAAGLSSVEDPLRNTR